VTHHKTIPAADRSDGRVGVVGGFLPGLPVPLTRDPRRRRLGTDHSAGRGPTVARTARDRAATDADDPARP